MSNFNGIGIFKNLFFKTNKINPNKTETAGSLLRDKLQLRERISPEGRDQFIKFTDEIAPEKGYKEINLSSPQIVNKKIDSSKLSENLYKGLLKDNGYLKENLQKANLTLIARAHNIEKAYFDQDKLAKNYLTRSISNNKKRALNTLEELKNNKLLSKDAEKKFETLVNFKTNENFGTKIPSSTGILEVLIRENYPKKNLFQSIKAFKAANPDKNSQIQFLLRNGKPIQQLQDSFLEKQPLDKIQQAIKQLVYGSEKISPNQKKQLMSEAASKRLKTIESGDLNVKGNIIRRAQDLLVREKAPQTRFMTGSAPNIFRNVFQAQLENYNIPALNQYNKIVKVPANLTNIQHTVNRAGMVQLQREGLLTSDILKGLNFDYLALVANPTNQALSRYENYGNQLLNQILKDKKLFDKHKFKDTDRAQEILERIRMNNSKMQEVTKLIPEDYQIFVNPLKLKKGENFEFKISKPPLKDFVGRNRDIAVQQGILAGYERLGIPKSVIKKANDKAYKVTLDYLKRGTILKSDIQPFEKLKFSSGGIVDLIRKIN